MVQLVDQHGRPIQRQALRREIAGPEMAGVRQILSGHPADGLTPGRLAGLLRDAEQGDAVAYLELAEQMEEKDLHYLAVLSTRKRAVAQLEITVEAASDEAADQTNADLVRQWLQRDELEDELFDLLDAIGKGYSVAEIVWEVSAQQWWPRRLEWRDPRWFEFDKTDGRTLLLRQVGQPEPLPGYKFVVHQVGAKSGLPIRGGLARAVCWAWMFKNYTIKDWISFAERFGMPMRVGKFHSGATEADKRTLLRAVSQLGTDAAAIVPDSMMIDFITAKEGGTGHALFKELADYLDQQVSKGVLGQTTTTDAISGGHAVSREHQEVRLDILRSDARQLAATLTRDIARPLIDLNRGPQRAYPRIVLALRQAEDLTALTANVEKAVGMGAKVEASWLRDKLGIPDPATGKDVELLGRPEPPAPGYFSATAVHAASTGAAPPRETQRKPPGQRDSLDDLALHALDEWEPLVDPLVAGVRQALAEAASLEDARERLAEALGRMDDAAMAELLARAGFAAHLAGAVGADVSEE